MENIGIVQLILQILIPIQYVLLFATHTYHQQTGNCDTNQRITKTFPFFCEASREDISKLFVIFAL